MASSKREIIHQLRQEKMELMDKLYSVCSGLDSLGANPNRFIRAFLLQQSATVQTLDNYSCMVFTSFPDDPGDSENAVSDNSNEDYVKEAEDTVVHEDVRHEYANKSAIKHQKDQKDSETSKHVKFGDQQNKCTIETNQGEEVEADTTPDTTSRRKSTEYEFSNYSITCLNKVLKVLWQMEAPDASRGAVAHVIHLQSMCKLLQRYPSSVSETNPGQWASIIRAYSPIGQTYLDFDGFSEFYLHELVMPFRSIDWRVHRSHCQGCYHSTKSIAKLVLAPTVCAGTEHELCSICDSESVPKTTKQGGPHEVLAGFRTIAEQAESLALLIARDFTDLGVECASTFPSHELTVIRVFNDYCSKAANKVSSAHLQDILFRIGYCVPEQLLEQLAEKLIGSGRFSADALVGWLRVYAGTTLKDFLMEDWSKDTMLRIAASSDAELWTTWMLAVKLSIRTSLHLHCSRTRWIAMVVQSTPILSKMVLSKTQIDFDKSIGRYGMASFTFEIGSCSHIQESVDLLRIACYLQMNEKRSSDSDLLAQSLLEEQILAIDVDDSEAEKHGYAALLGLSFIHVDLMLRDKVTSARIDHFTQVFNILCQQDGPIGNLLNEIPGFLTIRCKVYLAKTPSGKRIRSVRFTLVFQQDGMGWCDIFGIPKLRTSVVDSISINLNMLPNISHLFKGSSSQSCLANVFAVEGTWSLDYRRVGLSRMLKAIKEKMSSVSLQPYRRSTLKASQVPSGPFARPRTRGPSVEGTSWDPFVPKKHSFLHRLIHCWDTVNVCREYVVHYKLSGLSELLLGIPSQSNSKRPSSVPVPSTWQDLHTRKWITKIHHFFTGKNVTQLEALDTLLWLLYTPGALNESFKTARVVNWALSFLKGAQKLAKKGETKEIRDRNAMIDEGYTVFRECIVGLTSLHFDSGKGTGIHLVTSGLNMFEDNDDLLPDLAYYVSKA